MVEKIKEILLKHNLKVSTIESCTSGAIAAKLTSVEGTSSYFYGSMVTYDTNCKINQLGVIPYLIETYDVVSDKVAINMAARGLDFFNTDFCISITGYIGENKDVKYPGKVWICIRSDRYNLNSLTPITVNGSRLENREYCVNKAIKLFLNGLNRLEKDGLL